MMSLSGFQTVCSAKRRAPTQSVRGHQWWARDVYHLRMDEEHVTLCGRDCSEWLMIGDADLGGCLTDTNICKRCKDGVSA